MKLHILIFVLCSSLLFFDFKCGDDGCEAYFSNFKERCTPFPFKDRYQLGDTLLFSFSFDTIVVDSSENRAYVNSGSWIVKLFLFSVDKEKDELKLSNGGIDVMFDEQSPQLIQGAPELISRVPCDLGKCTLTLNFILKQKGIFILYIPRFESEFDCNDDFLKWFIENPLSDLNNGDELLLQGIPKKMYSPELERFINFKDGEYFVVLVD